MRISAVPENRAGELAPVRSSSDETGWLRCRAAFTRVTSLVARVDEIPHGDALDEPSEWASRTTETRLEARAGTADANLFLPPVEEQLDVANRFDDCELAVGTPLKARPPSSALVKQVRA